LLAVNTFVKDANDANPLIRALAVRTMGCIRVDRIKLENAHLQSNRDYFTIVG
jgi:vesicle coat complex subunit